MRVKCTGLPLLVEGLDGKVSRISDCTRNSLARALWGDNWYKMDKKYRLDQQKRFRIHILRNGAESAVFAPGWELPRVLTGLLVPVDEEFNMLDESDGEYAYICVSPEDISTKEQKRRTQIRAKKNHDHASHNPKLSSLSGSYGAINLCYDGDEIFADSGGGDGGDGTALTGTSDLVQAFDYLCSTYLCYSGTREVIAIEKALWLKQTKTSQQDFLLHIERCGVRTLIVNDA